MCWPDVGEPPHVSVKMASQGAGRPAFSKLIHTASLLPGRVGGDSRQGAAAARSPQHDSCMRVRNANFLISSREARYFALSGRLAARVPGNRLCAGPLCLRLTDLDATGAAFPICARRCSRAHLCPRSLHSDPCTKCACSLARRRRHERSVRLSLLTPDSSPSPRHRSAFQCVVPHAPLRPAPAPVGVERARAVGCPRSALGSCRVTHEPALTDDTPFTGSARDSSMAPPAALAAQ